VPAQRLTTPDLHWAAGFLDGEGCFCFHSHKYLTISAKQKYLPSLEKLKRLFGGGISGYTRSSKHSIYSWAISSTQAAAVMMTLYVLLSPYRREQIEKALGEWRNYKERYTRARRKYGV
jgi:hypothetical protein